ncbi:MAG: hypothetical protein ACJ76L_03220 [Conexibacter sp.]
MSRLPLLALALAVLAAASAQLAHADGSAPPVTSVAIAPSDGGAPRTLDLAALTDRFDVHGVAYTLRAADGMTSTTTVAEGISLTALLAAAGLDADAFTYLEIPDADGSSAIVLRDDLGGTDEGPPVIWSDAQGVHFLRPSGDDGDANAADVVALPAGPIAIALKSGDPLVPRIAVSTLRARPRERVDFSASLVGGAPLRLGLEYQWYFDGTGRVRGASVSHRFPPGGPYLVLLNVVRGDGTSIGSPATVRVHVVRAHERRSDDAHGSDESQGGGDGSGGGGGGGTGDGIGDGTGGGSGSGSGGSGATAPAYVAPVSPPAAFPPPTPAPATRHASPPPHRPRGDLVSGTLIASASAAAAPAGGTQAARAAVRGATSDGPLHLPVGIWVGAGLVLLLALGWVLESRHTLPFWQP